MKNKGEKKFGKIVISLIISIILFIGLLILEKNIAAPNGTAKVVIALDNITKGTVIDKNNKDSLFEIATVDGKFDFSNAIRSKDDIQDVVINSEVKKGEIISSERLLQIDDMIGEIKEPVETSIRVSDISQVVGGILREGDLIDISVVNSTTTENKKVLSNVYVTKSFSTDGKELDRNTDLSALTVNVIISVDDEARLNEELELGTVRVSKIK